MLALMGKNSRSGAALLIMTMLTLTGCAVGAAADAEPARTATPSPTVTEAEAIPTVSLQTTCGLLFGSNVDGVSADATDIVTRFVEAPDLSTVKVEEIEDTIDGLEGAAKNADDAVVPYIDAQVAVLEQLRGAKRGSGGDTTVNFTDFKAAALELLNQCERYL